jgi:endonuclease/exonuclease/phosphatase (EEP) superfamily protein YafD
MIYHTLIWISIILTLLPLIPSPHWIFRVPDFGKIQLFCIQVVLLAFSWLDFNPLSFFPLLATTLLNGSFLLKYTSLYPTSRRPVGKHASEPITILSLNVYQENRNYGKFLDLVAQINPDLILTMESDTGWDQALKSLDKDYPYHLKAPFDNTYGMHLFSRLPFLKSKIHFFVADDLPSMEAEVDGGQGFTFKVYALHPPPPSPTEEETSRERDGDLLSVAKAIRNDKEIPTVAIGDFNCVAWAEASRLFVKTSELIDPRVGRGFISTFHAKYKLLRFPIDQVYHTPDIFVKDLKTLPNVDSDHLPLLFRFVIDPQNSSQEDLVESADHADLVKVEEKIEEGKEETSER